MPACVPIRDLKNTAEFLKKVEETNGPVTVTRNGYEALVVMKPDDYEAMRMEIARLKLLNRVAQAEYEYATGQYVDCDTFLEELGKKHGL